LEKARLNRLRKSLAFAAENWQVSGCATVLYRISEGHGFQPCQK
jgi:hypothetical protein